MVSLPLRRSVVGLVGRILAGLSRCPGTLPPASGAPPGHEMRVRADLERR